MKCLLAVALLVAACGGSTGGANPSSGLATEQPLATENLASAPPASDAPVAPALSVQVTKAPGAVARAATASVAIKTVKGASCGIDVEYESGTSTAKGLGDKTADAKGAITWKWTVGRNTHKGPVPVTITCSLGDRSGDASTTLTVK